ncbi:GAF and ANTAR domain-containing protein [Phycicoccus flavus]|uniref:GAF and ANTAR domain-containing protein n=1 Tax=Phycicoccus flavus TaxID=2502783 RepID=UPI000FEBE51E|nr:GAF and ANTAR domain-containing protein [Phycicoccus flavus]NHA67668.1 GAF and ANTAR domain-containing protein [Phycicoccus flavus]
MTTSRRDVRARLGSIVSGSQPGHATADLLCLACVDLLGVDGAAISMVHQGLSRGTYGASGAQSRRVDEYQFTFGEGPCLDAVRTSTAVLVADLDSPHELRWPGFTDATLRDGIHAVFALPIVLASVCVGALDLFRAAPGHLTDDDLAGGMLAAELAALPLVELAADSRSVARDDDYERLGDLDRIEVHQATGMLISQLDVDAAEASMRLRGHAVATGRTASEVAWDIIERRLVLERDPPPDTPGGEGT